MEHDKAYLCHKVKAMNTNSDINLINVKKNHRYKDSTIKFFQEKWASDENRILYEDCISSCLYSKNDLPQWYLIEKSGVIIGGAGLITNDFISRMDLYPWLCALYVEHNDTGP